MPNVVPLTVAVFDKGGLTATCTLSVTITDDNDNAPTFAQSSHTIYVYNTTAVGAPLLTVSATDDDYETTTNGAFQYDLINRID